MPPRHAPPRALPALCATRATASLRLGLITLSLLLAPGVARIHAQSMPPAVAAPADPFHQPCVEVRASPQGIDKLRNVPDTSGAATTTIPAPRRPLVRKQYVDLDDRCATPPAFAPTRDVDSTSVWYVNAPIGDMHATAPAAGTPALHGLAS